MASGVVSGVVAEVEVEPVFLSDRLAGIVRRDDQTSEDVVMGSGSGVIKQRVTMRLIYSPPVR